MRHRICREWIVCYESQPESQTTAHDWLNELLELTPIVFLCPGPDAAIFSAIRRIGTGGLLQSNASCEQIVQALRSVAAGLTVFDNALAPQTFGDESALEELTPREAEVMTLIVNGKTQKQIAAQLEIGAQTAAKHRSRILEKLGVGNDVELTRLVSAANASGQH